MPEKSESQLVLHLLARAIHTVLYYRNIYSEGAFQMRSCQIFHMVLPQCRHPAVCEWINQVLTSLSLLSGNFTLESSTPRPLVLKVWLLYTITCNTPLIEASNGTAHAMLSKRRSIERYVFDISRLQLSASDTNTPDENPDIIEQSRALLIRLANCATRANSQTKNHFAISNPSQLTKRWTIGLEFPPVNLRPSLQHKSPYSILLRNWIPCESSSDRSAPPLPARIYPIRSIDTPPYLLELWLEQKLL